MKPQKGDIVRFKANGAVDWEIENVVRQVEAAPKVNLVSGLSSRRKFHVDIHELELVRRADGEPLSPVDLAVLKAQIVQGTPHLSMEDGVVCRRGAWGQQDVMVEIRVFPINPEPSDSEDQK